MSDTGGRLKRSNSANLIIAFIVVSANQVLGVAFCLHCNDVWEKNTSARPFMPRNLL
jgi:hypothetical protein